MYACVCTCVERLRECVQEGTCTCEGAVCTCDEGYEGNGIVCTAVNEAKKSGIVSSDSQSAGEGSVGTTIGAIIAVLLVIVLIAGGVFVVMHIRKNRTNKDTGDFQNTEQATSSPRASHIIPAPVRRVPGKAGDTGAVQNTEMKMSSPSAPSSRIPDPAGLTPGKVDDPDSAEAHTQQFATPSEENHVEGNRMEEKQLLEI